MRETELFELRRRIGMVFQESALFDSLSVEGNVAFRLLRGKGSGRGDSIAASWRRCALWNWRTRRRCFLPNSPAA